MIRHLGIWLLGLVLASGASAQTVTTLADGRAGAIIFQSYTPSTILDVLHGRATNRPVAINGTLTLPSGAAPVPSGRWPAMVIAHGSGGVGPRERAWAQRLNAWGIAAFIVDSFTLRGIAFTSEDQSKLAPVAGAIDAFQALKLLATHPAIDAERIGVMGFSKGGGVSMHTAFDQVRRSVIDGPLKFAAHVPFYPGCGLAFQSSQLTRAPILHLHGDADDWTPLAPCLTWMNWLRGQGVPVESRVYAGAHHGFDGGLPLRFLPQVQSFQKCEQVFDLDTMRRYDRASQMPAPRYANFQAAFNDCGVRGAHLGVDFEAQRRAIADVRGFLTRVFKIEIR